MKLNQGVGSRSRCWATCPIVEICHIDLSIGRATNFNFVYARVFSDTTVPAKSWRISEAYVLPFID